MTTKIKRGCKICRSKVYVPNCLLHAAAAELLEACKDAHRWIEKLIQDKDFIGLPEALFGLLADHQERLEEAIAKAEGREK